MQLLRIFISVIGASLLLSASPNQACINAGSLIGFIKDHTQNALRADDLEISKYHAYKALKTLDKSREQFEACGCDYASKSITDTRSDLVLATKIGTLNGAQVLLKRALENASASMDALMEHEESHTSDYANDVLTLNTKDYNRSRLDEAAVEAKIDSSLQNYRNSLEKVVTEVPCVEAVVFVRRIYEHCERQLLKPNLSPAKRYYNLQTKEITENALQRLRQCDTR